MLSLTTSPLQLNSNCYQVSCFFEKSLFQEDTAVQLGFALPDQLRGAAQKRKAEFIAGRYCARVALAHLEGTVFENVNHVINKGANIGIGANREPLWPPGLVGSISHTHGFASAAVARRSKVRSLGIDAELWIERGPAHDIDRQILTTRERYAHHAHLFESPLHYLTLVFSAKESLYKCLYPLVNRFFDFQSAVIIPEPDATPEGGQFRFELLVNLNDEFCAGYNGLGIYSTDHDRVHTAVIMNV